MEGVLKDIDRIIVETDEENPVTIAEIAEDEIKTTSGYRVRMRTANNDGTLIVEVDGKTLLRQTQKFDEETRRNK